MDSQDRKSERVNQKRRTRAELLRAARGIIEKGGRPSVAEVADAAGISRATAYRYFSTPEDIVREAVLDGVATTIAIQAAPVGAGAAGAEATLDRLVVDVFAMIRENESVFRALLGNSVAESTPNRRGARRIGWLREALVPIEAQMSPKQMQRLVHALSLVMGIEAMVVMRDICELEPKQAEPVLRWAAKTLLQGALREAEAKAG
jgi:AcrR family transcriptional regulator